MHADKIENRISPRLYGQFAEIMFGDVDGILWDELLRNRGFEEPPNEIGLSRDWDREPDDRDHDGAVRFAWDGATFYPGGSTSPGEGHSMRIEVSPKQWNAQQHRGISQAHIAVEKGVVYHGSFWLRGKEFEGAVRVELGEDRTEGRVYSSANVRPQGSEWAKYDFTLTPSESDPLAKFSILVKGTGTLWIDQASLMPGNTVAGARLDVFAKIEALHPSFLRWPGGNVAQAYHWMNGVGPRDSRPSWSNRAWWNKTETSDYGTDEYLAFCKALGTEASITVNVDGDGATPEEAAAWVEYVNGSASSKYGKMRAANGHPEPYGVKTWEVGNEIFGDWEVGHTDAATYARNVNRYAAAMKAVDPGIRLIAVGSGPEWNETLVRIAGKNIDEIANHQYYGAKEMAGDLRNLLAYPRTLDRFYAETRSMLVRQHLSDRIHLNVNEWNTSLPIPEEYTMKSGLFAGSILNGFERNGDLVTASAVSDLANGWPGGVIQASRTNLFVTPTYLVNELYNRRLGAVRLAAEVHGPTFDSPKEGSGFEVVDAIATRSADGKLIYIKAVNDNLQHTVSLRVHLEATAVARAAELESIAAPSPDAANSFASPHAVEMRRKKVFAGRSFSVVLPADSVSVLTLQVIR
ncbi:MAG: alpha-L-arabinofuranosidase C-terminal domain-containing protein [Acidobacteriota bacterium]